MPFPWPRQTLQSKAALTPVKGVLIICPWMVRNLDAGARLGCILKQIDVGSLVEAVMRRVIGRRPVEIVDVSVASERMSAGSCHSRVVRLQAALTA